MARAPWGAGRLAVATTHRLPEGEARLVHTGDGATIAVTVCGGGDGGEGEDGGDGGDGGGRTAVLPHCWTGGPAVWAPVTLRLVERGWRVVLYDQRGHGASTIGRDGCTIEALGRDLAAVLAELDLRDVVLAGHSMGGMTIQSYVAQHGADAAERIARIALVATAAAGLGRGRALTAAIGWMVGSRGVERLLRTAHGHVLVRGALGRGAASADVRLTRDLFVACPPAVRHAFLQAMAAMDQRASLVGTAVPLSILVGTRDMLTPRRFARSMAEAWPAATLITLDGRGHMLPLEAPDDVTAAITSE